MSDIAGIIGLVVPGFILLLTLYGAFLGMLRGRKKAGFRLILILICFLISLFAIGPVLNMGAGEALGDPTVADMLGQEVTELLQALPALLPFAIAMVKPIVFMVVFLALTIVTYFIYFIVTLFFRRPKKRQRKLGALLGAIQGLVVAVLILAAPFGYLSLAANTMDKMIDALPEGDESMAELVEANEEIIQPIAKSPAIAGVSFVTKPVFSYLMSFRVDGVSVSIPKEIAVILKAADSLGDLTGGEGGEEPSTTDTLEAIKGIGGMLGESDLFPVLVSEFLSAAGEAWDNGEAFIGVEKPDLGEEMAPVLEPLFAKFAEATPETVGGFFTAFTSLIDYLGSAKDTETDLGLIDLLSDETEAGQEALMRILTKEGFLEGMIDILNSNTWTATIVTGLETMVQDMLNDMVKETVSEQAKDFLLDSLDIPAGGNLSSLPDGTTIESLTAEFEGPLLDAILEVDIPLEGLTADKKVEIVNNVVTFLEDHVNDYIQNTPDVEELNDLDAADVEALVDEMIADFDLTEMGLTITIDQLLSLIEDMAAQPQE